MSQGTAYQITERRLAVNMHPYWRICKNCGYKEGTLFSHHVHFTQLAVGSPPMKCPECGKKKFVIEASPETEETKSD